VSDRIAKLEAFAADGGATEAERESARRLIERERQRAMVRTVEAPRVVEQVAREVERVPVRVPTSSVVALRAWAYQPTGSWGVRGWRYGR
jgi:predicted ABC-class ATPase